MSSDTHPDASEIPTLPPPDRAWHVPDGATSVFDDPAPAPSLPTLPTLPPAAPAVPMAAVAPAPNPVLLTPGYGYGDVPGGMAAVHRASLQNRTRRRPLLHRIVRSVVVLALIAGIVGAGYIFVQGFRDARALPAFDTERPAYGTVVITYEETAESGATSTGTVTASGDPSVFEIRSDPGAAEPIHMTSDGTTIIDQTDAEWSTYAVTPESIRAIESLTRLPMFEDYVPDVIRPFVSVADKSDVVVDGVGMERIELHIDHDDFAAADPVAAATWEVFIGLENDERTSRHTARDHGRRSGDRLGGRVVVGHQRGSQRVPPGVVHRRGVRPRDADSRCAGRSGPGRPGLRRARWRAGDDGGLLGPAVVRRGGGRRRCPRRPSAGERRRAVDPHGHPGAARRRLSRAARPAPHRGARIADEKKAASRRWSATSAASYRARS